MRKLGSTISSFQLIFPYSATHLKSRSKYNNDDGFSGVSEWNTGVFYPFYAKDYFSAFRCCFMLRLVPAPDESRDSEAKGLKRVGDAVPRAARGSKTLKKYHEPARLIYLQTKGEYIQPLNDHIRPRQPLHSQVRGHSTTFSSKHISFSHRSRSALLCPAAPTLRFWQLLLNVAATL